MQRDRRAAQHKLKRIRAEYLEMPGLRLTLEQAQRLCGVELAMCTMVLDALVDERCLYLNSGGYYARPTDRHHPHPAKARRLDNEYRKHSDVA